MSSRKNPYSFILRLKKNPLNFFGGGLVQSNRTLLPPHPFHSLLNVFRHSIALSCLGLAIPHTHLVTEGMFVGRTNLKKQ